MSEYLLTRATTSLMSEADVSAVLASVPALDTLPWIQQHRRIFFLGSWLGATIGGQGSARCERLEVIGFHRAELV